MFRHFMKYIKSESGFWGALLAALAKGAKLAGKGALALGKTAVKGKLGEVTSLADAFKNKKIKSAAEAVEDLAALEEDNKTLQNVDLSSPGQTGGITPRMGQTFAESPPWSSGGSSMPPNLPPRQTGGITPMQVAQMSSQAMKAPPIVEQGMQNPKQNIGFMRGMIDALTSQARPEGFEEARQGRRTAYASGSLLPRIIMSKLGQDTPSEARTREQLMGARDTRASEKELGTKTERYDADMKEGMQAVMSGFDIEKIALKISQEYNKDYYNILQQLQNFKFAAGR